MTQSRWEQWLYERHSKAELAVWAPTLRYFRYCRAIGGHANDGDQLMVVLRTEPAELERFRAAGAWVRPVRNGVEISLTDPKNVYDVTDETILRAKALEEWIEPDLVVDPPVDRPHCVSPQRYPELFPPTAP
jgi:hypothetical protein